jgi:protein-disulfide isomerase
MAELESARARKQTLQIAGIIGAIAVVLIGGALYLNRDAQPTQRLLPPLKAETRTVPETAEANGIAWGPKDAPIKIEEYIDYQCPGCLGQWRQYEDSIIAALAKNGKVRYEYNFLTFLETRPGGVGDSSNAANAAMCAADQNKFFAVHNLLFANQFRENSGQFGPDRLKELGKLANMPDQARFDSCVDAGTHKGRLAPMAEAAEKLQLQSTPSFVVNGKLYAGAQSIDDLKKIFAEVAPTIKLD